MKKIIVIIVGIILIGVGFFLSIFNKEKSSVISYEYKSNEDPPYIYVVKLNKETKDINLDIYEVCNNKKCEETYLSYHVVLTDDEYSKVMKLWKDHELLTPILGKICRDFDDIGNRYQDELKKYRGEIKSIDRDSNKVITNREFGDFLLDKAVK